MTALRRFAPLLPALALLGADDVAPVARVDRLVEHDQWDKAMEVCTEWSDKQGGVRDLDMRQSCAKAQLALVKATARAGDPEPFLQVHKDWIGTTAGDEALSEYLARDLKQSWDNRPELERLVKEYAGTKGIGRVQERLEAVAFEEAKAVGTAKAVAAYRARFPDADQDEEALALQQDLSFKEAAKADTVLAWSAFLAEWKSHPRRAEAEGRLRDASWTIALKSGGEALLGFARQWPEDARSADAWRLALPGLLTVQASVRGNDLPVWRLASESPGAPAALLPADVDTFLVQWRGLDAPPEVELESDDGSGWAPLAMRMRDALVAVGHTPEDAMWAVTVRQRTPDATSVVQTLPAGLCRPGNNTRFAVRVSTPQAEATFPFAVDAACRRAPVPWVAEEPWPMEIPPERVGVRCEGLRVRGGEAFRACGDVEAVWPADGWPFFLRIGPGAPGRPVVPGERMPQLATSAGWQGPVPRGAPLDSKVRASLKPSGTAPDCEAPPLPAGAQALVPDGAYVDPEGAPAVLAGVYGAAPVLQSDVDLTGDNALDRVLSIEDGARAWWFLLARSPDGDVRAWPIVGSTNLRASWATPYTYKGGRYVAISGALDGACVLRTLRWGANGPTFEIADPR